MIATLEVGEVVVASWSTFGNLGFAGHINLGPIVLVPNIVGWPSARLTNAPRASARLEWKWT